MKTTFSEPPEDRCSDCGASWQTHQHFVSIYYPKLKQEPLEAFWTTDQPSLELTQPWLIDDYGVCSAYKMSL